MDQGPGLTAARRRWMRKFVDYHVSQGTDDRMIGYLIRETYWPYSDEIAYALAYLGAVSTAEPIDLARVRDSRS